MASPPFDIIITVPGDTDTVSQFPGVERANLDKTESWILVEHNTYGTHKYVTLPQVGSVANGAAAVAPAPGALISAVYRDTDKAMKVIDGDDSAVHFLQVPPGTILPYGGASLPVGYLWARGGDVSRSTYARLFAAYGTTYGAGDLSTTFGLPDIQGRLVVGKEASVSRVTSDTGLTSTTLGSATDTGKDTNTLIQGNLPNVTLGAGTLAGTIANSGQVYTSGSGAQGGVACCGGSSIFLRNTDFSSQGVSISGSTGSMNSGTQVPVNNMPAAIVLNYIIKY